MQLDSLRPISAVSSVTEIPLHSSNIPSPLPPSPLSFPSHSDPTPLGPINGITHPDPIPLIPIDGITIKSSDKILNNNSNIIKKIEEYRFSILSINLMSLTKNITNLKILTQEIQTDLINVQEIRNPHSDYVKIDNFHNIIMKTRPGNKLGGGVGLYLNKRHKYTLHETINDLKLEKLEAVAIKATLENTVCTIVSIYRPPNINVSTTLNDLEKILIACGDEKSIITGDINIDLSKQTNMSKLYLKKLQEHGMQQHVRAYTRLTAKSTTLIDHTISNILELETMVTHHSMADHQTVITCWGHKSKNTKQKTTKENNQYEEKIHYKKSLELINKVDWKDWIQQNKTKELNEMYESFHETIQSCIVHEIQSQRKKKDPMPYITKEITDQRKKQEKARKKFLKKRTETNEKIYKTLKNEYTTALRKAKNEYYGNKFKKAGKDSRKTWSIINEILNRNKKKDTIESISHNGKELKDKHEIANILSDYYKTTAVSKIENIKSDHDFTEFLDPKSKQSNTFTLKTITKDDTWGYIKSIKPKTSSGYDNIPSKLMHQAAAVLVSPLTEIINKCFKEGAFPHKLKTAKITPIYKNKGPKSPPNLRPVNQLSCFSKVIEKGANEQLEYHSKSNHDDRYQFAYKTGHNTSHSVLLTRHIVEQELQRKKYVIVIMLDLSLAFDTLETSKILPTKMEYYGADTKTTNFFKSFFTDRKHYVQWNGAVSDTNKLENYSCVQGSCLGPPIYNHYTQDIQNVCKKDTYVIKFADDKNLILSDRDPNNLIKRANEELKKVYNYTQANTLLINKAKSCYMIFKPEKVKKN